MRAADPLEFEISHHRTSFNPCRRAKFRNTPLTLQLLEALPEEARSESESIRSEP